MEDHHWGSQGWNSAVEPEEEEVVVFTIITSIIYRL
jgi:hypothetical protein